MPKKVVKLSKSEFEVMQVLWDTNEPLTTTEIIKHSKNKTWRDSNVHRIINALLDKKAVEVAGSVQAVKAYARLFKPTISREEYSLMTLKSTQKITPQALGGLVAAFAKKSKAAEKEELISELEEIIDELKTEK